jgi:hypothetical protein
MSENPDMGHPHFSFHFGVLARERTTRVSRPFFYADYFCSEALTWAKVSIGLNAHDRA